MRFLKKILDYGALWAQRFMMLVRVCLLFMTVWATVVQVQAQRSYSNTLEACNRSGLGAMCKCAAYADYEASKPTALENLLSIPAILDSSARDARFRRHLNTCVGLGFFD